MIYWGRIWTGPFPCGTVCSIVELRCRGCMTAVTAKCSGLCVCTLRKGLPCGMLSGAAGQFLASPADLIKVRMQMDGRRELEGLKPRYSIIHSFMPCTHRTWCAVTSACRDETTVLCRGQEYATGKE